MRVLLVVMLFCCYGAFVQAHHCGKPTEVISTYRLFNESQQAREFTRKLIDSTPDDDVKYHLTGLKVRLFEDYYYMNYTMGNVEVANKFHIGEKFNENSWLGPVETIVTKINNKELTFFSTLSNGKSFSRTLLFDPRGSKFIIKSLDDNSTCEIYLEREHRDEHEHHDEQLKH